MAEREQKKKPAPAREEQEVVEEAPATSEKGEKIKAELDDLLDEIDEVLETNAEEFVKATSRRVAVSTSSAQLTVAPVGRSRSKRASAASQAARAFYKAADADGSASRLLRPRR